MYICDKNQNTMSTHFCNGYRQCTIIGILYVCNVYCEVYWVINDIGYDCEGLWDNICMLIMDNIAWW